MYCPDTSFAMNASGFNENPDLFQPLQVEWHSILQVLHPLQSQVQSGNGMMCPLLPDWSTHKRQQVHFLAHVSVVTNTLLAVLSEGVRLLDVLSLMSLSEASKLELMTRSEDKSVKEAMICLEAMSFAFLEEIITVCLASAEP